MATKFKVGDVVIFALGYNGTKIENEVGGTAEDYDHYLHPSKGATVTEIAERCGGVVSLSIGWNVREHHLRLKGKRAPEPKPVWAARWEVLMKE